MKLIDCFMYFNEKDIAYLRIKELYDVIDYFVINELSTTHKGVKRESYFWNDKRLKDFQDKICYKFIDIDGRYNSLFDMYFKDSAHFNGSWPEHEQRIRLFDQIQELKLSDEDIILFSDCDEIPNKNIFNQLLSYDIVALNQMFFVHFIDIYTNKNVTGTISIKYKELKKINEQTYNLGLQVLRRNKDHIPRIENGGWHYSYMGGPKTMSEKVVSIYEGDPNSNLKDENECRKLIDESIKNKKSPFSQQPLSIIDFKYANISNLNFITAINGKWEQKSGIYQLHPKIIELDFNGDFENLRYKR